MTDHVADMEKAIEDEETAKELMAKAADGVTLDDIMLRHPSKISPEDRLVLVQIQRRERARFALKESKPKGRKS